MTLSFPVYSDWLPTSSPLPPPTYPTNHFASFQEARSQETLLAWQQSFRCFRMLTLPILLDFAPLACSSGSWQVLWTLAVFTLCLSQLLEYAIEMIIFGHFIWTPCPYPHFPVPIYRPATKQVFSIKQSGPPLTFVQYLLITNWLSLLLFKRVENSKFCIIDSE